jgi:hypothetical protein
MADEKETLPIAAPPLEGRKYFSRVREAREILRSKATEFMALYETTILEAIRSGDQETAMKALQWYAEHVRDEDGSGIIEPGIDKPKEQKQIASPTIQIGFKVGGIPDQPALPAAVEVIEVKPEKK